MSIEAILAIVFGTLTVILAVAAYKLFVTLEKYKEWAELSYQQELILLRAIRGAIMELKSNEIYDEIEYIRATSDYVMATPLSGDLLSQAIVNSATTLDKALKEVQSLKMKNVGYWS